MLMSLLCLLPLDPFDCTCNSSHKLCQDQLIIKNSAQSRNKEYRNTRMCKKQIVANMQVADGTIGNKQAHSIHLWEIIIAVILTSQPILKKVKGVCDSNLHLPCKSSQQHSQARGSWLQSYSSLLSANQCQTGRTLAWHSASHEHIQIHRLSETHLHGKLWAKVQLKYRNKQHSVLTNYWGFEKHGV